MDANTTLFYTFTSFPEELLQDYNYVVLRSLKKDIQTLFERIERSQPTHVVGVAKTKWRSQIEAKAINRYNKTKKFPKIIQ